MSTDNPPSFENVLTSNVPIPAWWISREEQIQDFLDAEADPQRLRVLAESPGGRAVRYVGYGEAEPQLRGRANFNAALGGLRPERLLPSGRAPTARADDPGGGAWR